jgi:ubiquinone biosynthesis protein
MATARSPTFDRRAFETDVSAVVSRASGATAGEFRVAEFVGRLFELQRRHGVYSTPAFALAILSLLVFEGIAKEVDPDLDFQREAVPFVLRALA